MGNPGQKHLGKNLNDSKSAMKKNNIDLFQTMEYPLTRNSLQQMSRDELREQCRLLNYRVTGFKSELAERVLNGDPRAKTEQSWHPRPRLIKPILDEKTLGTEPLSPSPDREKETRRQSVNINHCWLPASLIVGTILFSSSF